MLKLVLDYQSDVGVRLNCLTIVVLFYLVTIGHSYLMRKDVDPVCQLYCFFRSISSIQAFEFLYRSPLIKLSI